jgi:hypothetical protein
MDEQFTDAEVRTSAALRRALGDLDARYPLVVDAQSWIDSAPRRVSAANRRLDGRMGTALGLAAVVALVAASVVVLVRNNEPAKESSIAATGLAHFANGISFDYPASWRLITHDTYGNGYVHYVIAVVGTGSWHSDCVTATTGHTTTMSCGQDVLSVGSGQIVVKIYRDHQSGPAVTCGSTQANATFGSLAVSQSGTATDRLWEIREPATEYFGAQNNYWIEARTDDPARMAEAEALVGSVRLAADPTMTGPDCLSLDPSAT